MSNPARQNVVITGSTKGIGLGLAREFLARGHSVVVSSRTPSAVEAAVRQLEPLAGGHGARVVGKACDVAQHVDVQALWDFALQQLGRVDQWINNAGVVNTRLPLAEVPLDEVPAVFGTNVVGVFNGSRVALLGMQAQGSGSIWNFEGLGSDGRIVPGFSLYGASKSAVTWMTRCLIKETASGPVRVGLLSPGIVITDLAMPRRGRMSEAEYARTIKFYNILADRVETVTPFLVEGVLNSTKHGDKIAWLTGGKALRRFLAAPFRKRDVLAEAGIRP